VYRSSPVGLRAQPPFLNAAARVRTRLAPDALVRRLLAVERRLGRRRTTASRGGPRVIDLDLLLWGDVIRRSRVATVPHPRLHRRRFALRPIVAVDPAAMHPVLGVSLRRLLARAPRSQRVQSLPPRDQRRFRRLTAGRS
jgi:2-amino-4-hydroxy-6-hydroxymethyldihydropteridine diphosphokinase